MKTFLKILLTVFLLGALPVYAASVLFPSGGGTGTNVIPTYGKILVGNAGGTYTLTATSSLGISGSGGSTFSTSSISATSPLSWNTATAVMSFLFNTVNTWTGLNTFSAGLMSTASSTIGDGTATGGLTINGGATSTLGLFLSYTGLNPSAIQLKLGSQTNGISSGSGDTNGIGFVFSGSEVLRVRNSETRTSTPIVFGSGCCSLGDIGISRYGAGVLAIGNNANGNTTGGLIAAASTTIGNGTQTGGLTVSGGATTTGNAIIGGTVSIGSGNPTTYSTGVPVVVNLPGAGSFFQAWTQGSKRFDISFSGGTDTYSDGSSNVSFTGNKYDWTVGGSNTMSLSASGLLGIGTTSPGSLLSLNGIANFTTATSTFYSSGGINLAGGCFAVNGVCVGAGAGTVTSVTGTYPVVSSGGNTPAISLAFGTTTANTWSQLQTFTSGIIAQASSTFSGTANVTGLLTVGNGTTGNITLGDASFASKSTGSYINWQNNGFTNVGGAAIGYGNVTDTNTAFKVKANTIDSLVIPNATGNVGIGTTTPGSLLSVQGVANFTPATSTLYGTGGINLAGGCFSIAGVCVGGGTSVASTFGTTSISALYPLSWNTSTAQMSTVATSSLNLLVGSFLSPNISQWTNDSGYVTSSFSTTSANYWSSLGLGFSTSSANAWGATKGYLTSAVTSVTGTYPVQSSGGNTPAISLAFGTSSSNTWGGTQTFTNAIVNGSLTGLVSANSGQTYASATSTLTPSSPLTGSFTQVGTGGSIGCTTAASGVAGCLSATAFDTFNNKVGTSRQVLTTYPVTGGGDLSADRTIALAFGTTTTNIWSNLQTFTSGLISQASSTFTGTTQFVPPSNTSAITMDGTTLNVDSTNHRIGMGIAIPLTPLHINAADGTNPLLISSTGNFQGVSTGVQFNFNNGNSTANLASIVAQLVNPNTPTIIFNLGTGASSALQEYMRLNSKGLGLGTTSPGSLLSLNGIANFTTATSTFYSTGGINLASGCFSIAGVCITGGSTGNTFGYLFPGNATTTGLGIYASSTIGNGTQAGGLTVSGGATTTGNALFNGTLTAPTGSAGIPSFTFSGATNYGVYKDGAGGGSVSVAVSGSERAAFTGTELRLNSGSGLTFSSGVPSSNAPDFGLSRLAAGKGGFGNGTNGDTSGTLILANLGLGTTSPGSLLSINGIANFTTATSTFYASGGHNLVGGGCYAINGVCIGGGATSNASSTLLADANTFSGLNKFTNAGTTTFIGALSVSGWTLATSTTVCLYPNHCQYQATAATADTAINAAVTYLQGAGGGTVNIMRGTYTLNAPILIAGDGITLKGEGNNSTILILKNSFNDYAIKVNDATLRSRLEFRNFKIDGNRANQTSGGCIMASSTARSTFDTLWLEACYSDALKLSGPSGGGFGYNNTISNNYIANNQNGIEMVNNDENNIYGNTINSFITYGIYDRQGLQNIHDNVFTGVVYNTGVAVYSEYTVNTQIHNNTFDSVPFQSIYLLCNSTQGQHQISNNYIYKGANAGTGKASITVDGCTRNQFNGNYEDATGLNNYGYQELNNAPTATSFSNNNFYGTTSAISFIGTGNASTTSFWNTSSTTPPNGIYWAKVDNTGQIGFNTPTGYGYKFGSNGTNLLTMLSGGNVGIGTSTPSAKLSVQSPTGVINVMIAGLIGATQYVFHVIDQFGHVITGGPVPTVGTCGTTPTIAGNDTNFRVLAGTGVITACTVTFANAYTKAPVCNVQQETGTGFAVIASSTPTGVVISGATLTSDFFVGHCEGMF